MCVAIITYCFADPSLAARRIDFAIETDHLTVGWGQKLTVGTSSRTLMLA